MVRALRSPAAVVRRSERKCFPLCGRQRRRRILDVRAADMQEEMAEQPSVPSAPTKTAAHSEHRSERSEQSHTARCASS